jgi:alpha-L-fucosidase 2
LVAEARAARPRLAPNQIGKHGQLQEWLDDWDEIEPNHRHLSPLWGLYPGSEISPESTAAIAAAAAVTLTRRGTGGCGWSYAWKAGLRARLYDGTASLEQLRALLTRSSLPNLFSLCGKALQVDGNLGATAAIAEMLLQSQQSEIHLLPALPPEWASGSVAGLRARGGFTVDMTWADGRLTEAGLYSSERRRVVVRAKDVMGVSDGGGSIRVERLTRDRIGFMAEAGARYRLRFTP